MGLDAKKIDSMLITDINILKELIYAEKINRQAQLQPRTPSPSEAEYEHVTYCNTKCGNVCRKSLSSRHGGSKKRKTKRKRNKTRNKRNKTRNKRNKTRNKRN
jgi:hypothetical protein